MDLLEYMEDDEPITFVIINEDGTEQIITFLRGRQSLIDFHLANAGHDVKMPAMTDTEANQRSARASIVTIDKRKE